MDVQHLRRREDRLRNGARRRVRRFLSYARSDEAAAAERGDRQQRERRLRQSGENVRSAAGRRMTPAFSMMRAFEDVAGAEKTSGRSGDSTGELR
jgi:hypothetical protein